MPEVADELSKTKDSIDEHEAEAARALNAEMKAGRDAKLDDVEAKLHAMSKLAKAADAEATKSGGYYLGLDRTE